MPRKGDRDIARSSDRVTRRGRTGGATKTSFRPIGVRREPAYLGGVRDAFSNDDMLAWFSEDERECCSACGERACVSLAAALASFCMACGAIKVDGRRIDTDGRITV